MSHKPSFLAGANPPATEAEIAELVDAVAPLHVPDSLLSIARWHNGGFMTQLAQEPWFSLAESIDAGKLQRDRYHTSADGWIGDLQRELMPIPRQWLFVSGYQFSTFVELTPQPRADSPEWLFLSAEGPAISAHYSSLEMHFRGYAEQLRSNATEPDSAKRVDPAWGSHQWISSYYGDYDKWPKQWDRHTPPT